MRRSWQARWLAQRAERVELLFWLVVLGCTSAQGSTLRAHALFSDRVVLQTTDDGGAGSRLSGTGAPFEMVTLTAAPEIGDDNTATAAAAAAAAAATFHGVADASGRWEVAGISLSSGGPYSLTLRGNASAEVLVAREALVGEVFLCSGQSNMVFGIGAGNDYRDGVGSGAQSIENATAELAAANATGMRDIRLWMVPSPAKARVPLRPGAALLRSRYDARAHGGGVYVGARGGAQTNLTGGCDLASLCYGGDDPLKEGCDNGCDTDADPATLVHDWTAASADTVGAFSAVCFLAARDVRRLQAAANPGRKARPVGLIASYVGGTPVGCWANDHAADSTCNVVPSQAANVPCDPAQACCPAALYDDKIAPLAGFNVRAVLWYQGEANTDEGYTRSRREYACQMRLLIDTWRAAWGYALPFFWVQLHGWGPGGRAGAQECADGDWSNGRDVGCQFGVRLGQAAVAADADLAGTVGLASAVDGCEADAGADTCNLHPGWKSVPAARLATAGCAPPNKSFGGGSGMGRTVTSRPSYTNDSPVQALRSTSKTFK